MLQNMSVNMLSCSADVAACAVGKTAMLMPTGEAPHIPFHLGPVKSNMETPTPTDFSAVGARGQIQPPPGLGPSVLAQPASNMSAAQQLKERLTKGN